LPVTRYLTFQFHISRAIFTTFYDVKSIEIDTLLETMAEWETRNGW
jgi:hypothetical protein